MGVVTVSDTVVEWESDPDVPVTVTVEVPAALVALVAIVIATAAGVLPGVIGVAG
jgi:hypothetical protein